MINWIETNIVFGYGTEILNTKRPLVICACDSCNKLKPIRIRNKSSLNDNQMYWLCPSCVKKRDSVKVSTKMKDLWANKTYRQNQLKTKSKPEYKLNQSTKSKLRWADQEYQSKIKSGIDRKLYIDKSTALYGNTFDYSSTFFLGWHDRIDIKCNNCNHLLNKDPQKHLDHGYCQYCNVTKGQREISDFIISSGFDVVANDRSTLKNYELDIFIPSNKIALEYHGIYWHSYDRLESKAEKERHQKKALLCISRGIKLLQFYDFEWSSKKHIVKSMISNSLNMSSRLNARAMKVEEIDDKTAKQFFSDNHLLGYRSAKTTLALCDSRDIHFAMSFSKANDGYEIIRMASNSNELVRGGASKILSHFTKRFPGQISSYADLRYSNGNSYNKLGFKQVKVTPPGYFYYKSSSNSIISRQQCQKSKLLSLLGSGFDPNISESQNMFSNGYRRVWTAGNILYIK